MERMIRVSLSPIHVARGSFSRRNATIGVRCLGHVTSPPESSILLRPDRSPFPDLPFWGRQAFSSSSSIDVFSNNKHPHGSQEWQGAIRKQIRQEAATLTRTLFRLCLRSARYIQKGNEHDEKEFEKREKQRLEIPKLKKQDPRFGMLSELPPEDREDEFKSRTEYYLQYTRENFYAEMNCLHPEDFHDEHFDRYIYFLRKGEERRRWLLSDMKFDDPLAGHFDVDRVDRLEEQGRAFFKDIKQLKESQQQLMKEKYEGWLSDDEDEGLFSDSDSEDTSDEEDEDVDR